MTDRYNQKGESVVEETLYSAFWVHDTISPHERDQAISLLCQHLKVRIFRTNATKRGEFEIHLEED